MEETKEKGLFYAQGLRFSCTRCSSCCRYESGYVFLSENDLRLLTAALNMDRGAFMRMYCRWVYGENGDLELSLREKSNHDCVFWAQPAGKGSGPADPAPGGGCSVYEARPLQCRSFPFWPSVLRSGSSWETAASGCPGMGQGAFHSRETIEEWLALRRKEPVVSRDKR